MKLNLTAIAPVSLDGLLHNAANAKRLGFPRLGIAGTPRLAVVGGGTSIGGRIDEIRAFDGDVWAINGAFQWCREHGIEARFYSADPTALIVKDCVGARSAMLCMATDPAVFEELKDADVEAVEITGPNNMLVGPTSACCAPLIALHRGYTEITFFGCESSFGASTHAYGNFNLENLMRVACNGQEFLTTPDMMMQVENLGGQIRTFPQRLKDRSGGLLSSYIESPEIDVLAATRSLYEAVQHAAA